MSKLTTLPIPLPPSPPTPMTTPHTIPQPRRRGRPPGAKTAAAKRKPRSVIPHTAVSIPEKKNSSIPIPRVPAYRSASVAASAPVPDTVRTTTAPMMSPQPGPYRYPIPVNDMCYRECLNNLRAWMRGWEPSAGLPVLEPVPLTREDAHLLFKSYDVHFQTGGHLFHVVPVPKGTERCLLQFFTYQKRKLAVIILTSYEMFQVLTCVNTTWFQSGGSLLSGYLDGRRGIFYIEDVLVFRGKPIVHECNYTHRRAWITGPVGVRPTNQYEHVRMIHPPLAHSIRRSHYLGNRVIADTDNVSEPRSMLSSLSSDVCLAAWKRVRPAPVSTSSMTTTDLLIRKSRELASDIVAGSELHLECLPSTLYPDMPNVRSCGYEVDTWQLRGECDYSVCIPVRWGFPTIHDVSCIIPDGYDDGRMRMTTEKISKPTSYPRYRSVFFSVPSYTSFFRYVFYAWRSSLLTPGRLDLWTLDDVNDCKSHAFDTALAPVELCNSCPPVEQRRFMDTDDSKSTVPPLRVLVTCEWNPDRKSFIAKWICHERAFSDTKQMVEITKRAQLQNVTEDYLRRLRLFMEDPLFKNTRYDDDVASVHGAHLEQRLCELVELVPMLAQPDLPLLSHGINPAE